MLLRGARQEQGTPGRENCIFAPDLPRMILLVADNYEIKSRWGLGLREEASVVGKEQMLLRKKANRQSPKPAAMEED